MSRTLKDQLVGLDPRIRYRGLNQTRIETFSDAVFALAITLVILSSTVPKTFAELRTSMADVVPFFLCVILLVVIWTQHYKYFLKYGLQDQKTIVFNTFLLFLVLVYVYPLKFLMKFLITLFTSLVSGDFSYFMEAYGNNMQYGDMPFLMMVYGLGASLIFLTLAMLYRHAYKRRVELELDEYEIFDAKSSVGTNLLMGAIPMISFFIALIGSDSALTYNLSGFIYMLYPIIMPFYGMLVRKKMKKLFD